MKNHLLIALCIVLLLHMRTIAQTNRHTTDSLEALMRQQQDSMLVSTLNELTWQYRMVNRDTAILYGNQAIELGSKIKYLKGVAQAYNDLGIIFYDMESYDSAVHLYEQAMQIRRQQQDELGMAKLYNKIGVVYQKEGKKNASPEGDAFFVRRVAEASLLCLGFFGQIQPCFDHRVRVQRDGLDAFFD